LSFLAFEHFATRFRGLGCAGVFHHFHAQPAKGMQDFRATLISGGLVEKALSGQKGLSGVG